MREGSTLPAERGELMSLVDADGPCDYCRNIDQVCSVDIARRSQKPFYFVSEEEYRLLCKLCKRSYPGEDLNLPNLRRLVSAGLSTSAARQQDAVAANNVNTAINETHSPVEKRVAKISEDLISNRDDIPLLEIVSLASDLGCMLLDIRGVYRE